MIEYLLIGILILYILKENGFSTTYKPLTQIAIWPIMLVTYIIQQFDRIVSNKKR